jgi:hypothetical protein
MKKVYLLLLVSLIPIIGLLNSCNKKSPALPIFKGTVIGYDPCTGGYTDNPQRGYVIKIESLSDSSAVFDTATTYNLPAIFNFPTWLFYNYRIEYKFLLEYRDKYKFKFSYRPIPDKDKRFPICTADIFIAPFLMDTKGRQIAIVETYGILP